MSIKYYFKKPKTEIGKDIIKTLAVIGVLIIAGQSPYFTRNLLKNFQKFKKYNKKYLSNTFLKLKKRGLIEIRKENNQIYISLTKEGKKKAGWYQINDLKIKSPKKWDRKWRIVIFDIPHDYRIAREALRGKLKQLDFVQLQKSVWIHAFDCKTEIKLLRNFFGLEQEYIRILIAEEIENDTTLRKKFNLI